MLVAISHADTTLEILWPLPSPGSSMSLRIHRDAPLKGTRKRTRSQAVANTFGWRVRVAQLAFALVTAGTVFTTALLLTLSIGKTTLRRLQRVSDVESKVPLAFIITVPGLCACIIGMPPYFDSNRLLITLIPSPRIGASSIDICLLRRPNGFKWTHVRNILTTVPPGRFCSLEDRYRNYRGRKTHCS
jgi:hypothetical protein